ncbi:MAG TPA: proline--tRNA ligase [bacterium]|nr:proline--tRNA ligase [bacterium]
MRYTNGFFPTLKEIPQEAEIASHQLMIRAGYIQKLSSGLYTYLPLGLRVIQKVQNIIREELGRCGAIELLMPILQPREIWERSGRYTLMGELMMKCKNREQKEFILAPTHEEIVTDIVSRRVNSYKQLPLNFYQIQTKFRDELRPRFGVVRAKEFIMKDGYSFDADQEGADKTYLDMYKAYERIFKRCGLKAVPVRADTGVMGGNESHEFMVLAASGEDGIAICKGCGYAANTELAERIPASREGGKEMPGAMSEVHTPELRSVDELAAFFKTDPHKFIKTMIYTAGGDPVAVLCRGDVDINEVKLKRALNTQDVALADPVTIERATGAPVGFAGPVGLKIRMIADLSIHGITNAVTGANKKDTHVVNVNMPRDFKAPEFADIGVVKAGDECVKCQGTLDVQRGVEVGQVFKLGTKYSITLDATYLDKNGEKKPAVMGCYGIGVSRTVAAIIEQNNDENGIVWPMAIAPYEVAVLPISMKDEALVSAAMGLYNALQKLGIEAVIDDREESAGIKFKDADLIGFPVKVILGPKSFKEGNVEIKMRKDGKSTIVPCEEAALKVRDLVNQEKLYV